MWKKILKFSIDFIGIFFLIFALYLVWREVHNLGFYQIVSKITELPLWILAIALMFILCDYLAFSGYDFLALHYIGAKLKKWLVIKTSFVAFSITNTTGHAYIAGGSIRYFFYSKAGLNEFQVFKMIAFESLTFLMGMGAVLDVCLILSYFLHLDRIHKYQRFLDLGSIAIKRDSEVLPKAYIQAVAKIANRDRKDPHKLLAEMDVARWDMMNKAFNRNRGDGLNGSIK